MTIEKQEREEKQIIGLDSLLELLGNSTRRLILAKLAKVPHSAPELANDLGISRQAVHNQLDKMINDYKIIEIIDPDDTRGGKYRIRGNISIRVDMSPNYFNIKYSSSTVEKQESMILNDLKCANDYSKIKSLNDKVKFLGDEIVKIEQKLSDIDDNRQDLIHQKKLLLFEIRRLMKEQYRKKFEDMLKDRDLKEKSIVQTINQAEEVLFTMFFNPNRYFNRINIDNLLEDLFFSGMDIREKSGRSGPIKDLLEDMSRLMGFLREDDDDWFFDF
ncbi:MAG: ArsR/SmtB family transcription factor [Candidatus Thorarchaeota archaeon]